LGFVLAFLEHKARQQELEQVCFRGFLVAKDFSQYTHFFIFVLRLIFSFVFRLLLLAVQAHF
jgi:hypothetical protein